MPGPYISQRANSAVAQPEFSDACNGVYVHVKCPPPRCGTSRLHEQHAARISVRARRTTANESELVESVRIVGGSQAEPEAYPFIVGIFRDGKFHCGGSIYNEHWIISAAHCCDNFHQHYYEVRSGMLRKRSFAPQVQITRVTHMIVHHAYSSALMANDIALMRVEHPFHYNRWVRPICMPERHRTTNDRDWIWGPKPGTVCTAVGWGALRERGGAPDHLMQVSVPILSYCKHRSDRESLQICAAEEDGGHDACQGDSGGPFVCQSKSNPFEWFLAGVVSHGEGCARAHEPGVYTRVALFIDWIAEKVNAPLPARTARADCPGMRCIWGGGICLPPGKKCNGYVNCLGGEDESGCGMDQMLRSIAQHGDEDSDEEREIAEDSASQKAAEANRDGASTSAEELSTTEALTPEQEEPTTGAVVVDEDTATTTHEASAEAQESLIVTKMAHQDPMTSTTPALPMEFSPSEVSSTEASSTEKSSTEQPATESTTSEHSTLTSSSAPSSPVKDTSSTASTIIFPDTDQTDQVPTGFELIAPVVPPTTETLWKALEKTVKEVRGQARTEHGTLAVPSTEPTPEEALPEHPFFDDLKLMHQAKHKRVAELRLTVHNLHTKAKSTPVLLPNDTAQYRQFLCRK
uniref:Peptidase S1 domain-containing protein n=1 Tax=Anopheles farauti TaxID=69004 RepID=A0A182Q8Q8_9DIPT